MIIQVGPCTAGWSPAEIIAAVGVAVNSMLLTFLVRRRIQKDQTDNARWVQSGLDHASTQKVVEENACAMAQLNNKP